MNERLQPESQPKPQSASRISTLIDRVRSRLMPSRQDQDVTEKAAPKKELTHQQKLNAFTDRLDSVLRPTIFPQERGGIIDKKSFAYYSIGTVMKSVVFAQFADGSYGMYAYFKYRSYNEHTGRFEHNEMYHEVTREELASFGLVDRYGKLKYNS